MCFQLVQLVILTLYSSDTLKTYSTLSYSPLPRPDVSPADARLGAGDNKTGACYSNCFTAKLTRKQRAAAVLHHSPSGPHICFKCTWLFPPLCNITPQPCNWQLHIFSLAQVMAIAARAAALRFPVSLQAKVRTMESQHRCVVCDVNVPLEAPQRAFIGV